MLQKATTLGSELTESNIICHQNWLYEFLEPSDEEIMAAYIKLNGPEPHHSDADESSSVDSDEESDDVAGEDETGEAMQPG